jgi:hypothetical protein
MGPSHPQLPEQEYGHGRGMNKTLSRTGSMIGHFQGEDKKSPLPCKEIHAPGHNGRKMSYKYTAAEAEVLERAFRSPGRQNWMRVKKPCGPVIGHQSPQRQKALCKLLRSGKRLKRFK